MLEALALLAWRRLAGRGPGAAILPNLAAGACLLAALRAVLGGAGWMVPCACLLAGLVAHLVDLRGRWAR